MADVTILYGSQTGCAQDLAERLQRQGRARRFRTALYCMDEYDLEQMRTRPSLYVFVASTTGQGVAPDNMKVFWRAMLRRTLPGDLLACVRFAVFGLGDSSYPIYNAVARRLHQRLLNLGARPFHDRGLGDDQDELGIDGAFEPWATELWRRAVEFVPGTVADAVSVVPAPIRYVTVSDPAAAAAQKPELGAFGRGRGRYTPVMLRCSANQRLTPADHWQDVRLVEFELSDEIRYMPGDVLVLHPSNPADEVERFLRDRLRLDPDTVLVLARPEETAADADAADDRLPHDQPVTARDLFVRWLDVFGTPRRFFFEVIAEFAGDPQERDRLLELGSVAGQDDLLHYNYRERRTYIEVLDDFASVDVPLGVLLEILPRLRPRQFSIASSPARHGRRLQVAVAIVEYRTPYKRPRIGLCSRFLRALLPGDSVPCWTRAGSFTMPSASDRAVIMIGPGTGIAPFRSMCHEMSAAASGDVAIRPPELWVFFGCRNRAADFLFETEWMEMVESGAVSRFEAAFSRDQPEKIYVQDRMALHGAHLYRMLSTGAVLYLAGSSNPMPKQVHEVLIQICMEHGGISREQSEQLLRTIQKSGRYLVETW